LRDLTIRASVSGMAAWVFALIGCFLQPGFASPTEGFFIDRVTAVVMVAVALPLWVLVYGLKLVRDRRRRA
jgi:zinc transporter ZupT